MLDLVRKFSLNFFFKFFSEKVLITYIAAHSAFPGKLPLWLVGLVYIFHLSSSL